MMLSPTRKILRTSRRSRTSPCSSTPAAIFLGGFSRGDDCWRAHARAPFCEGETLAEAVARLWLLRERSAQAERARMPWFRFRRRRRAEQGPDLRTVAADLDRLVRQAQALQTVLLPYLIDMALLEAQRLLRDGE